MSELFHESVELSHALRAENQFGQEAYTSPVICGGRIYLRVVARNDGRRQEMLHCIGQ